MKLVSIIIPCFNVETYINECLQSAFNQSYTSIEVICVDNNSSDHTVEKLNKLKSDYYPDLIVTSEKIKGAGAARNKGLKMARGEWVQFLDADDLLAPNKVEEQMKMLNSGIEVGLIVGASKRQLTNGSTRLMDEIEEDPFLGPFINKFGNTCSNLWAIDDLKKVKGWNESLTSSQETDLMLRMILNGTKCVIHNDILTLIIDRESGQISQSNPINRWSNYLKVRVEFLKKLNEVFPDKFLMHKIKYHSFLLSSLLILGKYDRALAVKHLKEANIDLTLTSPSFGVTRKNLLLIRLLGFSNYLLLKQKISKLFRF